jgi:hypothetical protein
MTLNNDYFVLPADFNLGSILVGIGFVRIETPIPYGLCLVIE